MSNFRYTIQKIFINLSIPILILKKVIIFNICEKNPSLWGAVERKNIRKFVKYVYSIPFYKKRFDSANISIKDIREREDFLKLPLLSKNEYRTWINETVSNKPQKYSGYRKNVTSGSTGIPLVLYEEPFDSASDIANLYRGIILQHRKFNFVRGKILHIVTRSTRHNNKSFLQKLGLFRYYKYSLNDIESSSSDFRGDFGYISAIDFINEIKPDIIQANKTALFVIFDYALRNNIMIHKPKLVLSMGEMMDNATINVIKHLLGEDVLVDVYGSAETGNFAFSRCGVPKEYMVWQDSHIINVICPKEDTISSLSGEIAITALEHKAFPLVNYCLGDEITIKKEVGRIRISCIKGRCNDYLIGKSEKKYTSSYFMNLINHLIQSGCKIKQYRVQEDKIGFIICYFVLENDTDENRRSLINCFFNYVSESFRVDFDVSFVFTNILEPDKNGKLKILMNNIS